MFESIRSFLHEQPRSLSEVFNREVEKTLQDYPALKGKFALINLPDNELVGKIDPYEAGFRSHEEMNEYLNYLAREGAHGGSSMTVKYPGIDAAVIVYKPLPFNMFTSKGDTPEMEAMATFDHELGHVLVRGSMGSRDSCYRESAADAFAVLRHIQRYGDKSRAIELGGWRRAYDFVTTGDAGHYTTLAIDEITALKDKLDIAAMTPEQTVMLAARIALKHVPHADITDGVSQTFTPFRRMLAQTGDMQSSLKVLAKIILADENSYFTFKIGSRMLEPFLNGTVMSKNGASLTLDGPFWDDVREKVKARLDKIAAEGILADMPLKGKPRASSYLPSFKKAA